MDVLIRRIGSEENTNGPLATDRKTLLNILFKMVLLLARWFSTWLVKITLSLDSDSGSELEHGCPDHVTLRTRRRSVHGQVSSGRKLSGLGWIRKKYL